MNNLVKEFRTDRQLLEMRGSLIVRQLSSYLDVKKIFLSLAAIVEKEEDFEFASLMVQVSDYEGFSFCFALLCSVEFYFNLLDILSSILYSKSIGVYPLFYILKV